MANAISPLHLPILAVAGGLNRHRQRILDHLKEENRIFKEQLGGRRPRMTDDQRRRLAVKGKALGRSLLVEYASLVTPETILRWHHRGAPGAAGALRADRSGGAVGRRSPEPPRPPKGGLCGSIRPFRHPQTLQESRRIGWKRIGMTHAGRRQRPPRVR